MACKNVCRVCDRLTVSRTVTFAGGVLTINIPEGSYRNGCKYCIQIEQAIPAEATITAPVVITIGDGTVEYPLTGCDCAQVTACALRTRTLYSVRVATTATGGTFKMLGRGCCAPNYALSAIDGTDPAAG